MMIAAMPIPTLNDFAMIAPRVHRLGGRIVTGAGAPSGCLEAAANRLPSARG
jgi:hypothetical protein